MAFVNQLSQPEKNYENHIPQYASEHARQVRRPGNTEQESERNLVDGT
jgi:hypothetical protein